MPPDPYFYGRTQQYVLPEIQVGECTDEHSCCCSCDGCDGGEYARPYGPVPPVEYGPWPDEGATLQALNGMFKAKYASMDWSEKLLGSVRRAP